jgi:cold shock CspA family protein
VKNYTFAVLVDGENASPKDFPGIIREVEKQGDVAIQRVYADWTQPAHSNWKETLHTTGARPVHQFNYGKDAADHALIMDAIELTMSTPRIDAVCIVSSDGGYHTLALRIREKGLYVMGIGKRNTPERLRRACHHFVYSDLLDFASDDTGETKEDLDLDRILLKAFNEAQEDNEAVYLGILGTHIKRIDPAFDPRSYSFKTLKGLVQASSHLFKVDDSNKSQCFVSLCPSVVGGKLYPEEEGVISRWINHYGFIDNSHGSYFFNKINVVKEHRDEVLKKGDRVKFKVIKRPNLSADSSAERNGKANEIQLIQ